MLKKGAAGKEPESVITEDFADFPECDSFSFGILAWIMLRAQVRASRVIVSNQYPIGLCFSIGNFNRVICTKGKKAGIIQSIDANEANENSRVMPGYGEMRSEA